MDRLLVSTVTPVRRGAPFVRALVAQLSQIRDTWERDQAPIALAESIVVVDGAEDASEKILHELREQYPWLRVISLSRSFGRQAATIAGILHTSGDWVISLDENAQPKAEQFGSVLKDAALSGGDVIYIEPSNSPGLPAQSRWERLLSRISGIADFDDYPSHRLMRGSIARAAAAISARQTNFDIALRWFTTRIRFITQDLGGERIPQQSSGELSRLQNAWRRIVSTENRLPSAGFAAGAAAIGGSLGLMALLLLAALVGFHGAVAGLLFSLLEVVFLTGVVLIATALILSYVAAHFMQSLGQPVYFEIDRGRDQMLVDYFSRPESHATLRTTSQSS